MHDEANRVRKSDDARLARSAQEQAVAAWVNYLNELRLDSLLRALRRQDENLEVALASVEYALKRIDLEVVASNRGGIKGMHGFIAEVAEVGVGNARNQILGEDRIYEWVNNNGPVDLLRRGVGIQQKFVAAGGRSGLGAIAEHLRKYPNFLENGGRYQIPADHYEVVKTLHAMPHEEAVKSLTRGGGGPSFKDWKRVQAFFEEGAVSIESLEPSNLEYPEVQRAAYRGTLNTEKKSLRTTDRDLRDVAHQEHRPTLWEGAKATGAAAAIEGGAAFITALAQKRRRGKKIKDFTPEDWIGIASATGINSVKGSVRGASIYALTNAAATPAAVASSVLTAAFGIADQAHRLRRREIEEVEFIENAELLALEAAISALASVIGQALIPLPVLGAVIGTSVGTVMYSAVSSALAEREVALIKRYLSEQRVLDDQLAAQYHDLVNRLRASMSEYLELLERAFSLDVEVALHGSAQLALALGVAPEQVLDTDEKVLEYFLD